jgi:hypothetical protein
MKLSFRFASIWSSTWISTKSYKSGSNLARVSVKISQNIIRNYHHETWIIASKTLFRSLLQSVIFHGIFSEDGGSAVIQRCNLLGRKSAASTVLCSFCNQLSFLYRVQSRISLDHFGLFWISLIIKIFKLRTKTFQASRSYAKSLCFGAYRRSFRFSRIFSSSKIQQTRRLETELQHWKIGFHNKSSRL